MITSSPKKESSSNSGTTTYADRSRSSSSEETTKPIAPPPSRSGDVSPRTGSGLPLAMWTMPRMPKASAVQPITWRPAGPLRTGSRMTRHPVSTITSGTNQPILPTEPVTMLRTSSMTPPGISNHTAAATTTAMPKRKRPAPSRRWSGSSSRALRPMPRAPAPTAWATPSQTAEMARNRAWPNRAIGPGPLRTARGGGARRTGFLPADRPRFFVGFRALRDRVLEPLRDALLLREPGGEDVRVAMVTNVGHSHTSHTHHRLRVAFQARVRSNATCRERRGTRPGVLLNPKVPQSGPDHSASTQNHPLGGIVQ